MSDHDHEVSLSRRSLLQAAGGVTFLALAPLVAAASEPREAPLYAPQVAPKGQVGPMPLFTALPYIQPGPGGVRLIEGAESMVVAWQTNGVKADYEVVYGQHRLSDTAEVKRGQRWQGDQEDGEQRLNFSAVLENLKLGTRYQYRVSMNGERILEGYFSTRKPRGSKTQFVAFGDNSFGEISDRQIAYQAYQAKPDFVINTGDNVYENGLDNEYARYFFPVYNSEQLGSRTGAPLLRSVPFYTVIANHDVHVKDANKHPIADFSKYPDSLAYFTAMHLPLNGFDSMTPVPITGPDDMLDAFKKLSTDRFPKMANYSFDYADLHFTCLDSNVYIDPTSPVLQEWLRNDLSGTDAKWKFVVFHHPSFNVGEEHYHEQHMRVLSPIFEELGVDLVLHGHEHTYQRTKPIKFAPAGVGGAAKVGSSTRMVPGKFTIDHDFDGVKNVKPKAPIYIVTGAGGKHLYDPKSNMNPKSWLHEEDDNVAYVEHFISDRHSLSMFEVDGLRLKMTQIDEWGRAIDEFVIDKH